MFSLTVWTLFVATSSVFAAQIFDIWTTTWDRTQQLTYTNLGSNPINFVTPGSIGSADIVVNDGSVFQSMVGYGATLTDSSALVLNNLKNRNSGNYDTVLRRLFDITDGANAAGLSYLRVPLGASDFSDHVYSFTDDRQLNGFNINNAPSYLFSVINDIQAINPSVKLHLLPWSPPGWMKDSGTMNGGSFNSANADTYATYLLKALQAIQGKGIKAYAIGLQNEPENNNPTYPTCLMSPAQQGAIGTALRSLMNSNGFSDVRITGYDHNWNDAAGYPVQLMNNAANAFAGVAFHCYDGNVAQQDAFHSAYPGKEIYFTECTGQYGTDYWSNIKWYMDNIFIGAAEHFAKSGLMWTLALDGNGNPKLPGANSCSTPCRPVVTVNDDGSYSFNEEFYVMGQAAKAIIPKDANGPFGKRIGVSVGGSLGWALRVSAYVTERANSADWNRYSLVVLNWNDNNNGNRSPSPVTATIEFRGTQAKYTFPVGVTTLWWFDAPKGSASKRDSATVHISEGISFKNASSMRDEEENDKNLRPLRFRRNP